MADEPRPESSDSPAESRLPTPRPAVPPGDVPREAPEPDTAPPEVQAGPLGAPAPTPPTELSWQVPGGVAAAKVAAAVLFAAAGVLFARDEAGLLITALAALAIGAYALRDLLAPVRLAADGEGLTVISGYAGKRKLPWSQIERIRIDVRQRLGLRSELLEIDAGSSLHLFSAAELGAPVDQVADALRTLRTGR